MIKERNYLRKLNGLAQPIPGNPGKVEYGSLLKNIRTKTVTAVTQAFPKKPDWPKMYSCKQSEDESPSGYLNYLKDSFEQRSDKLSQVNMQKKPCLSKDFSLPSRNILNKLQLDGKQTLEKLRQIAKHY